MFLCAISAQGQNSPHLQVVKDPDARKLAPQDTLVSSEIL